MDSSSTIENGNLSSTLPQAGDLPQEGLLQIALRCRWLIFSTTVVFLAAAFLYLLKAPPIYTSTSRLYVEQSGPRIIDEYKGIMTQSKNYLYTQGELVKSTPIVAEAVDNAQFKQFRTFAGTDNVAAYVKKSLNVTIGRKDDIIAVSFDSPYPVEAAQVVNAVVDSYINYHSARKRTTVSEVLKILQKEKVKRDEELSEKFEQMLEFTRTSDIVSFDNKGEHIVLQRLTKLSEALTEAQLATVEAKADFEAVKNMADEPGKVKQFAAIRPAAGVRIFVNDLQVQLQSKLEDTQVELKNAKLYYTDNHPSIQAIRAKIEHIKAQLDEQARQFADAYLGAMKIKWITAKQRESELQTSFETQRKAAQELNVKAAEYSVLQSELKRTERLCDILDNRIKELNITEDTGALNISILEVARPATSPSKPQKARVMAIALVIGLMFGSGFALLRDWLDYRLRSTEEISAVLGVPILGVVPTMSEDQPIVAHGQRIWLQLRALAATAYRTIYAFIFSGQAKGGTDTAVVASSVAGGSKNVSEKKVIVNRGQKVHLKSKSLVAEAYRTIRTAVFFGVPKGQAKTILITSPAPGDGKSTLVSNLAITMAQAGQRTLILDADFRKPMQRSIFEIDSEKGLSSSLAGTITLDEAIQPCPVEGLDLLSCGPEVPNPSEILNSDAFAALLADLSQRYDRIVVDSPPVTLVADSQILAAICDVTLLVLRAGKSSRRLSQQARDSLLSVGAHILGVIVNDVPRKQGRYGYYSGYGYYPRYGYYSGYGYYGDGHREKKKKYQQEVST